LLCRGEKLSLLRGTQQGIDSAGYGYVPGHGRGGGWIFVDQMADRLLVSTRGCSIPADLESELRDTGMPVFHKKLEQNQKETF